MGSDSDDSGSETHDSGSEQHDLDGDDGFGDDFDDFEAGAEHEGFNDFEATPKNDSVTQPLSQDVPTTTPNQISIPDIPFVCCS